jgi:hypothetical protein
MVIEFLQEGVFGSIFKTLSDLGIFQSTIFRLAFFTAVILAYSLFVFYSYRLFSKKNLFDFNFNEYLNTANPTITSIFGFFLYIVEYIFILPFFIILWFGFYSIFLLILARNLEIQTILLISSALISAIRISSFASESLSKDLAKMLPFTLLALALVGERFFSLELLLERFSAIPSLISSLPIFLLFIFGVEIVLRFFDAINIFVLRKEED